MSDVWVASTYGELARVAELLEGDRSLLNKQDSWDGRTHSDTFMISAGQGAVFDTLTENAADGSLRGELATDWEASPDASTAGIACNQYSSHLPVVCMQIQTYARMMHNN